MAQVALYRKYRSRDFGELIGQEHITKSLSTAIEKGRIGHAYLFTGPRGVGKTSMARILAKSVNELAPDIDLAQELDVIEIDAASNRRIDEIRDLRDKVHVAPVKAKYKVYIIDEVHMLTNEAFNALLKTLEEPPSHVIFILATTEPHKLPDTIISRTQHFSFRPIAQAQVVEHLRKIAVEEGIDVTEDALNLIAQAGGGSFRDSISILDQVSGGDKTVDLGEVERILGRGSRETITAILQGIAARDTAAVLHKFDELWAGGSEALQVHHQIINVLRQQFASDDAALDKRQAYVILKSLSELPLHSPLLSTAIEAACLSLCLVGEPEPPVTVSTPETPAPKPPTQPKEPEAKKDKPESEPTEKAAEAPAAKPAASGPTKALTDSLWLKTLANLRQSNSGVYALLRSARIEPSDAAVTIFFRFQFHRRRLEERESMEALVQELQTVCGGPIAVTVELEAGSAQAAAPTPPPIPATPSTPAMPAMAASAPTPPTDDAPHPADQPGAYQGDEPLEAAPSKKEKPPEAVSAIMDILGGEVV